MAWVRLDDSFAEHPKIARLSNDALALWVVGLAYCNRNLTDGFIPRQVALAQLRHCSDTAATISELEQTGMWDGDEHGWRVHDFFDYQPSKADVLQLRGDRKAAGSLGGKASSRAKDKQVLKQNASKTQANGQAKSNPVPVPEPEEEQELSFKTLSPRYAAAHATLAQIAKAGYAESKFTPERFASLADRYPEADLIDEAERLRDWELYGAGERQQTRDGIARFRNWLKNDARPKLYAVPAEVDYPWLPGAEPAAS